METQTFADGDTDFQAQLTKVAAAKPEVLAVSGLYRESALLLIQARQMGLNLPVMGGNGFRPRADEDCRRCGGRRPGQPVAYRPGRPHDAGFRGRRVTMPSNQFAAWLTMLARRLALKVEGCR